MALGLTRFALVFGMVLAMAVIILTITTGAGPPVAQRESTAPIAAKNRSTGLNSGICSEDGGNGGANLGVRRKAHVRHETA